MSYPPTTICFPFVGDSVGGSHLSTLILIQHLDRQRFRPLILVHEKGPLTEHLERNNIAYELLPLTAYVGRQRNPWRQIAALAGTFGPLRRFLRHNRVAIVHTQDARMHVTWTLPARAAGIAVVWHQRTQLAPSRLARAMLYIASRVICISRFVFNSLPRSVMKRAETISNPVMLFPGKLAAEDRRAELCREAGTGADAVIVATIGNLREIKRPMLFVEAAAHILRQIDRPTVFAVFGEDREGFVPRMRAYAAREGFGDRLLFLGFCDPIEPWIAACDLVVAPSVGDAFGRTLVEAMLLGIPVVATDAGGHGEIVRHGETGLLVPPDDAGAMAAACVTLLRNPEMASAITARAREDALTRYDVTRHVERICSLYGSVISSDNRRSQPSSNRPKPVPP